MCWASAAVLFTLRFLQVCPDLVPEVPNPLDRAVSGDRQISEVQVPRGRSPRPRVDFPARFGKLHKSIGRDIRCELAKTTARIPGCDKNTVPVMLRKCAPSAGPTPQHPDPPPPAP